MARITPRRTLSLLSLLIVLLMPWSLHSRPGSTANKVQLNGQTFTLPAGFEIELAAGPPLVDRPITADFDEQGRFYVADSSGSNEKVAIQLDKKPHRIVRLEDTKKTGRFDKSTVFADKMMFPEGTMWHAGSLYVAAPPSIWKLTDTTGAGIADKREEWFKGITLTGCANDLHGPYAGPDGWIYWCKGAFANQVYERPGKKPFVTRSSHVFRCRPDGSGLEPVMTGGMDNPVDVVFTPGGERIITTTFLQYPAGGKRDGLIHIIYGGIYGKEHDSIYEHKWTGPEVMPVLNHLGPAAPAGLHRYESTAFGPEYQDNLFAALFNLQKVTRHVLQADGATFKSRVEDFVVSDNKDFHPTDIIEDADGSLLIVDTGGWYKLCCPSSQLYKPDIKGAIYRVRRTGAPRIEDPRGLALPWAKMDAKEVAQLLGDARPAVRRRAIKLLGENEQATPALMQVLTSGSVEARRSAVWSLTRNQDRLARQGVRKALADADDSVRQTALNSISLWRDKDAVPALLQVLKTPSMPNRRAAAEALGRIGDIAAVPALLAATGETTDRSLEHSLTYALIEIADQRNTAAGLESANPNTRRAALTALDQMEDGKLSSQAVTRELGAPDARLKEAAWWIAGRHAEWGPQLSGFLRDRLAAAKASAAEREDLLRQLTRLAKAPAIQALLAEQAGEPAAPPAARRLAIQAMAQAGLKKAPTEWLVALEKVLPDMTAEAVTTLRALDWGKQRPPTLLVALQKIAGNSGLPAEVRLRAMAALPDGPASMDENQLAFLCMHLKAEQPSGLRSLAAEVISRAKLTSNQLVALTDAFKITGPMELDRLLDTFTHSADERVGLRLVEALNEPAVRASVRLEALKPRLAKYGPLVQKQALDLYATLDADAGKQRARLEDLSTSLPAGDLRRGQGIFNNPKVACVTCHSIGYLGGKVGPDLTRIGSIRTERDLLEAIVFPNSSFVRGYEPVLAVMKSGKTHNGILKRDTPDEIVLVLGPDQEVRLARADIEELQPGRVSVMPSGLDQQLTRQDLADLVAFLKACK
ncbi:MAG TPA: PVC-type heme-binding CxxCH protein [Gemmataceae bacterium]|jgi:putative membrane-bound dehydrogenase-like protein|nr:PVC-type heme-binding CxxCH protein [Gemmataceae bacterium]